MENIEPIPSKIIDDIVDMVKVLLKIEDLPKEATKEQMDNYYNKIQTLNLYAKILCNNILIYTNRKKLPEELKYVIVDLIVDRYSIDNQAQAGQFLQSMSEAGRSITYGTTQSAQTKLDLIARQQIAQNQAVLNRYRLVYKI